MDRIALAIDGPRADIVLSHAASRNGLDAALAEALHGALDAIEARPEVRLVVFRSGLRAGFSAGPPLQVLATLCGTYAGLNELSAIIMRLNAFQVRLARLPAVTAVLYHGFALGGGLNLFLGCDVRLATRNTRFIESFLPHGLPPDLGASYYLPRLMGETRATALLLSGRPFDGAEAAAWGLLTDAVEKRADLDARLAEALPPLGELCGGALADTLALLRGTAHPPDAMARHLDRERVALVAACARPETRARLLRVPTLSAGSPAVDSGANVAPEVAL